MIPAYYLAIVLFTGLGIERLIFMAINYFHRFSR